MLEILPDCHSCANCADVTAVPTARSLCKYWLGSNPLRRPNGTCLQKHSLAVEQVLAMVRFDQRSKLAEIPDELVSNGAALVLLPDQIP